MKVPFLEPAKIFLACILAAVLYGIVHEMFTAHLCVEYFSVFHPPVFNTDSPTLLALGWGVIATWRAGGIIGAPLALVSRSGSRPKLVLRDLIRPITIMIAMAASALSKWRDFAYVVSHPCDRKNRKDGAPRFVGRTRAAKAVSFQSCGFIYRFLESPAMFRCP